MLLEELRAARAGKGLTREEAALRSGLTSQTVKRLEAGVGSIASLNALMASVELRIANLARGATINEQIANRRHRLELTLEEVAQRAGVTRKTVAAVERGDGTVAPLLRIIDVLAPNARPSKPVRASWNYENGPEKGAVRDMRFTPPWFLDYVVDAFGEIDLDPAGHELSHVKAARTIILPENGLSADWSGTRLCFLSPPFSALVRWLNKAADAFEAGDCQTIVMLIPTRTDSATYHDRIAPHADIGLVRGRMKFTAVDGPSHPAPFSMMVAILGGQIEQVRRFGELVPCQWIMRDRICPMRDARTLAMAAE